MSTCLLEASDYVVDLDVIAFSRSVDLDLRFSLYRCIGRKFEVPCFVYVGDYLLQCRRVMLISFPVVQISP